MAEVKTFLSKKLAYVNTSGTSSAGLDTDTVKFVLKNMTGKPKIPV